MSLADLRGEFGSTLAILAAHIKDTDKAVLAVIDADMAEEPAREQLFDVLMRRLELLEPHKEALRSLMRSAARNPGLALALNAMAVRSQQWMLTAANINAAGPLGQIRAQGLALMFANAANGSTMTRRASRTLAALDGALASGQRWSDCWTISAGSRTRLATAAAAGENRARRRNRDEPMAA